MKTGTQKNKQTNKQTNKQKMPEEKLDRKKIN